MSNPFEKCASGTDVPCLDCTGLLTAHDDCCPTNRSMRKQIADDRSYFADNPFRHTLPRPACYGEWSYARAWERALNTPTDQRSLDEVGLTVMVRKVGDRANGGRMHTTLSNGIKYTARLQVPLPMVDPDAGRSFA